MSKKGKQITLYLSSDTISKIDKICKTSTMSKSGIVGQALDKYIESLENLFYDEKDVTYGGRFLVFNTLMEMSNNQLKILERLDKIENERKAIW